MKLHTTIALIFLHTMLIGVSLLAFGQGEESNLNPGPVNIHLFTLPEGVSEEQLTTSLTEINQAISDLGYWGAGYQLYKVEVDSIQEPRYFIVSLWLESDSYRFVHDHEAWKQVAEKHAGTWDKIQAENVSGRLTKINVNN